MTTEVGHIEVSGVHVDVLRKNIKNLHVGVYPPSGHVRVSAPHRLDDEAIRLAIISRLGWIRRQRAKFERQDRQTEREFVTGESHYYQGRRYRLDVVEDGGRPAVALCGKAKIELRAPAGTSKEERKDALNSWYRKQLQEQLPGLVAKWEVVVGAEAEEVRIKRMKTRWGSCNPKARRIWLNLELAKKPMSCLEYVIVHELLHFQERGHNGRFRELMDRAMPRWRQQRDLLNQHPLAHDNWSY